MIRTLGRLTVKNLIITLMKPLEALWMKTALLTSEVIFSIKRALPQMVHLVHMICLGITTISTIVKTAILLQTETLVANIALLIMIEEIGLRIVKKLGIVQKMEVQAVEIK